MTTRVLLDLDGVLVDFVRGICEAHGVDSPHTGQSSYDTAALLGMTDREFWVPANDVTFWENLEWTPDGKQILEIVSRYFHHDQICLLTSPSQAPEAAAGKMRWIQRELPDFSRQFLIGPVKHFCAHPEAFLIDDHDVNCDLFAFHGGRTLRVPRPWNSNWMLDPLSYISAAVEVYAWQQESPKYLKQIEERQAVPA